MHAYVLVLIVCNIVCSCECAELQGVICVMRPETYECVSFVPNFVSVLGSKMVCVFVCFIQVSTDFKLLLLAMALILIREHFHQNAHACKKVSSLHILS